MSRVYMGADVEEFIFGEATYEEACKKEETETPAEEPAEVEESNVEEATETEEVEEAVEVTDEEINAFGVIECVDDPDVACYRIALENEMNYNAIMNAFMTKEFSVLESTGEEMVYEAADVKKFFTLIKETVARWWSKIQGVFRNIIEKIAEFTDRDLRFVKKYKDANIVVPDKKFPGFDFSKRPTPEYEKIAGEVGVSVRVGIKNISKFVGQKDAAKDYVDNFNKEFSSLKDKMRGYACGNGGKAVSEDAFEKELKVALFGSEEKVEISIPKDFKKLLGEIENAKVVKGIVKNSYKKAQTAVKELHKEIKYTESVINKKGAGMQVAKCLTDSVNASLRIMSKALSMETRAIMTELKQNRTMAAYCVANQEKPAKEEKKANNESAIDDLNVVLI